MKASEVLDIWLKYGANYKTLRDSLLVCALFGSRDFETRTTTTLMAVSEAFERENCVFGGVADDEACTSCSRKSDECSADWTYGHRPGWWVCAQCERVLPCKCETPDRAGCCTKCARVMTSEEIAEYHARRAEEEATQKAWEAACRAKEEAMKAAAAVELAKFAEQAFHELGTPELLKCANDRLWEEF